MNNKKESNPKQAMGGTKVPFSTLSQAVTAEVGLGMLEGALKYGRHNWRVAGARASTYIDATNRHLSSWWEGEDIDPYSGLSHITKAICSLYVLRDAMINENWVDDRPPALPEGWIEKMNEMVQDIKEKYPDVVEPFTQVGQDNIIEKIAERGLVIEARNAIEQIPLELDIEWNENSIMYSPKIGANVYMFGMLPYRNKLYVVTRDSVDSYMCSLNSPDWVNTLDKRIHVKFDVTVNYSNYYAVMDGRNTGNTKICKSLLEAIETAEEWNSKCS